MAVEYVGDVLRPTSVDEFGLLLQVEPTDIERSVVIRDDILWQKVTLVEILTGCYRVEAGHIFHSARCDARHLRVTDCRVEILLHPPDEPLAVNIHDDIVAARLDARKGDGKEFR